MEPTTNEDILHMTAEKEILDSNNRSRHRELLGNIMRGDYFLRTIIEARKYRGKSQEEDRVLLDRMMEDYSKLKESRKT